MRYDVLCHPFRASRGTHSYHVRSYVVIAVTCALCVLGGLPSFMLVKGQHGPLPTWATPPSSSSTLGTFSHEQSPGLAYHWLRQVLTIFIPGVLLGFFNVRLIQALRQIRPAEGEALRRGRGDLGRRLPGTDPPTTGLPNLTLVAVVVMFVCLVSPSSSSWTCSVHLAPHAGMDAEAVLLATKTAQCSPSLKLWRSISSCIARLTLRVPPGPGALAVPSHHLSSSRAGGRTPEGHSAGGRRGGGRWEECVGGLGRGKGGGLRRYPRWGKGVWGRGRGEVEGCEYWEWIIIMVFKKILTNCVALLNSFELLNGVELLNSFELLLNAEGLKIELCSVVELCELLLNDCGLNCV